MLVFIEPMCYSPRGKILLKINDHKHDILNFDKCLTYINKKYWEHLEQKSNFQKGVLLLKSEQHSLVCIASARKMRITAAK